MDSKYIESEGIVERYLAGDLLVREARAFEKYCLEHPELLARLPIPVRLKTRLARRPFEDSETGVFPAIPSSTTHAVAEMAETVDDDPLADPIVQDATRRRRVLAVLGLIVAAFAGGAWYHVSTIGALETQLAGLRGDLETARLRPPSGISSFRLTPGKQGPQSAPATAIGWPDPPQLLELRIDVMEANYNNFAVTIEKTGEARILQIRRLAPDSNRELRLALNSSAFGPGEYLLQLQGYTWRGELVDAGWMRLELQ